MTESDKSYRQVLLIGFVFLSTLPLYAVIGHLFASSINREALTVDVMVIRYVLFFLAFAQLGTCFILRKMILSSIKPEHSPEIRTKKLLTAAVISFAFSESSAIYGLILMVLSGNLVDFYFLLLLSVIGFAFYFPRRKDWESSLQS